MATPQTVKIFDIFCPEVFLVFFSLYSVRYFQSICEYQLEKGLKYFHAPVNTARSVHLLPLCKVGDGERARDPNTLIAYSTRCALIGQFDFGG